MSLLTVLSLEPTTMREVRQRAPAHVIVRKALTGEVLGTLKVFLPFTIRLKELAENLEWLCSSIAPSSEAGAVPLMGWCLGAHWSRRERLISPSS